MQKTEENTAPTASWPLIKRLVKVNLRPYYKPLSAAIFCMVIGAAMTGVLAERMQPIIDDVFTEQNKDRLWPVALSVFAAFFVRGLATYGHTRLMNTIGHKMITDVQKDMFARLIGSDLGFFQSNSSGQLISRMTTDTTMMRTSVADSMTGFGKSILTLMFLIGVMLYQDWKLTLVSFFVFPVAAWLVSKLGKKLRNISTDLQEEIGFLTGRFSQSFQGVRQVKAYGMEGHEKERINSGVGRVLKAFIKAVKVSTIANPMSDVLSGLAIVTIIVYGGSQVIAGNSTPGQLFSFITAFMLAYEPMKRVAKLNNTFQMGLAAVDRIFAILDSEPEIKDKPDAKPLQTSKPTIALDNATFLYPDGTKALDGLSLEVSAGKTVALVGPSGAGKSTILNLIPRFYDVESGRVLIDGTDIRDFTIESLRGSMALVTQEVALFDDSIRDNIRYGSLDASEDEIIAAAKGAVAHDFIMEMPDGYDTIVGENGVKLSGGQRQRIAIARAMLRNAPILLLDEATSALDTESERAVQGALETLQKGRTTLIVAHRLSTIRNADLIYVLNEGKIAEQGTHAELLAKNGVYAQLYSDTALEAQQQAVS